MSTPAHWDDRYRTIGATEVSWYEERPTTSLELLEAAGVTPTRSVIDVGGGSSLLVDHLLRAGHTDLTVLDLSAVALDTARARLDDPREVTWIHDDLRTWEPARRWDAWHDRAVLHFLVDDGDRDTYVRRLRESVTPGGAVVIGVFAEDGPDRCSGLPVRRYGAPELRELLGDVDVVEERHVEHRTPIGATQAFRWLAARLRADG